MYAIYGSLSSMINISVAYAGFFHQLRQTCNLYARLHWAFLVRDSWLWLEDSDYLLIDWDSRPIGNWNFLVTVMSLVIRRLNTNGLETLLFHINRYSNVNYLVKIRVLTFSENWKSQELHFVYITLNPLKEVAQRKFTYFVGNFSRNWFWSTQNFKFYIIVCRFVFKIIEIQAILDFESE